MVLNNFSTKNNLRKLENFVINCKQKFIYLKRSKNLGYGFGNNLEGWLNYQVSSFSGDDPQKALIFVIAAIII